MYGIGEYMKLEYKPRIRPITLDEIKRSNSKLYLPILKLVVAGLNKLHHQDLVRKQTIEKDIVNILNVFTEITSKRISVLLQHRYDERYIKDTIDSLINCRVISTKGNFLILFPKRGVKKIRNN